MNQELKAKLAPAIKAILKKHRLNGSLSVRGYSKLVLTIKAGNIDLIHMAQEAENYRAQRRNETPSNINRYGYFEPHKSSEIANGVFGELFDAMNVGNHDNSDCMTDYFDVGWYTSIMVGTYDKPYIYSK